MHQPVISRAGSKHSLALAALAVMIVVCGHAPTLAQSPASAASATTAGDACPRADLDMAKDFEQFTEAVLAPGKVMNIPELLRAMPPETRAKMAALQKAEAERKARDWPNLCRYVAENVQL